MREGSWRESDVLNDNCGLVTVVMCLAMAWSLLGAVEKKINEKKDRGRRVLLAWGKWLGFFRV